MAKKSGKKAVKEYTASCVSCGTLVCEEQKFALSGKNYCTSCAILAKKEEPALSVPSGIVKWLCYLVSFFGPLAGFVLAIVYLSQKDAAAKSFGRHCMIVVCISLFLIAGFLLLSFIAGLAGVGAGTSGLNIGEGYY